jgi:hypothetical protein
MSLNATSILRHIERKLGASHHLLEISQDDMIDTIVFETLPTFSNYFPHFDQLEVTPGTGDDVPGHMGWYFLRTDFEILGVSKVLINFIESGIPNISAYYSNPFDMQLTSDMESAVLNPTTFKYRAPDKVEIFPKNTYIQSMYVEIKCVHPKHFQTIPMNLREEFLKLAYYDICESIYPIRHRFQSIGTTFGNIDLFMDQIEQASDKRQELIETWRSNVLKNSQRKKLFIY